MCKHYNDAEESRATVKSIGGWETDAAHIRYSLADRGQREAGIEKAAAFAGGKNSRTKPDNLPAAVVDGDRKLQKAWLLELTTLGEGTCDGLSLTC